MDRWKSRGGKSQRREEERRSEKRNSQRKEDADARKGSRDSLRFSNDLWLGGSKSRLAKAAGVEPFGR